MLVNRGLGWRCGGAAQPDRCNEGGNGEQSDRRCPHSAGSEPGQVMRLKPGTDARGACHCRHRASCTHHNRVYAISIAQLSRLLCSDTENQLPGPEQAPGLHMLAGSENGRDACGCAATRRLPPVPSQPWEGEVICGHNPWLGHMRARPANMAATRWLRWGWLGGRRAPDDDSFAARLTLWRRKCATFGAPTPATTTPRFGGRSPVFPGDRWSRVCASVPPGRCTCDVPTLMRKLKP